MAIPKAQVLSSIWRDGSFDGKVVFATGGAGSLVSVQVQALVQLGANACIIGRNVAKTERVAAELSATRPGAKVLGFGAVDVRKPQDLEKAVARCVQALGSIDFVIAGAAGNFLAPIEQISYNAFKSVIDIDLMGSWNTLKATLPELTKSAQKYRSDGKQSTASGTGGRIIFISATLGYMGNQLMTHAVVAKAGVDALSVQTAIEYGPRGITSNVIAPGAIIGTEGTARLISDSRGNAGRDVPSGRMGHVKDISDATIYLFSDAGNYVNGETLVVDGGAWHTAAFNTAESFAYPDFLLSGEKVQTWAAKHNAKL
ncbi:peroxisomal 2 4-dienoyl-CoA reductase sps19 [Rhinocladiella similis]